MKKNICLTIHSLIDGGGEERMCTLLANELYDKGYKVIVVTLEQFQSQKNSFPLNKEIKQYSLRKNRVERKLFSYRCFQSIPLLRYRRILKQEEVNVIIDVDIHQSLVSTRAVKDNNIKIISWDHFNYERFKNRWSYKVILNCFNSGKIDKFVVLTKSDRKSYIDIEGFSPDFIKQIYNPSPIESDTLLSHNSKTILAIGRLQEQKGFDLLLKAWAIVEDKCPEWHLEIVGEGAMKEKLLSLTRQLKIKRVVFSNFTSQIEDKYKSSSIYVLSSRYEGFPLVLLEALSMSLPLVSFDCKTGPSEIIKDGYNGFLVEPENTDLLAKKLLQLIEDDKLRKQMSNNAFVSSKKYKKDSIINQWCDLLDSI